MGSTYVEFREQGFEATDSTIAIWLLLLVEEIDAFPEPPAWLREVREEWHLQATAAFGFGVVPGLDAVVTSAERRDVILSLCSKAMRRLQEHRPVISRDELNAILKGGEQNTFLEDVGTEVFERVGDYFIKLLRGELKPEECDARLW